MSFSQGAPDSDVVLSGQELLAAIADVLDLAQTDDEMEESTVELKRTSENQDLRVGERASKRRRSAGTCLCELPPCIDAADRTHVYDECITREFMMLQALPRWLCWSSHPC